MTDLFQIPTVRPMVIVISGPSGAGKDVVLAGLKSLGKEGLCTHFVVTTTSRERRPNEVDGRDYHFVTTEQFQAMIDRDEFVEHALVYDQYKGVTAQEINSALASGEDVLLRIDVQGTQTIKALYPDALTIFLLPDDEKTLRQRLTGRETDTEESIQKRLYTAHQEMKIAPQFDYLVVNHQDQLAQTVKNIVGIVRAEKCRTARIYGEVD